VKKLPKNISRLLHKIELVVIRSKNGHIKLSKPCKHCINYLKYMNIKRVYYSLDSGDICYEKIKDIHSEYVSSIHKIIPLI
jgi:Mg2+ and Co2+ transporter CorA